MHDKQKKMEQTLEELLEQEGILGAALVSRDGIPLLSRFTRQFDQMAFSILVEGAMVATLVGAAEEALAEVEGGALHRAIVEAERIRLMITGAADDLILVVLADREIGLDALDGPVNSAVESVRKTTGA